MRKRTPVLKQRWWIAGVDPTSALLASDETVSVVNRAILGDVRRLFLIIFTHTRGPEISIVTNAWNHRGNPADLVPVNKLSMNLTSVGVDDRYLKALIVSEAVVTKMPCKLFAALDSL
jgi:hypothetical protein